MMIDKQDEALSSIWVVSVMTTIIAILAVGLLATAAFGDWRAMAATCVLYLCFVGVVEILARQSAVSHARVTGAAFRARALRTVAGVALITAPVVGQACFNLSLLATFFLLFAAVLASVFLFDWRRQFACDALAAFVFYYAVFPPSFSLLFDSGWDALRLAVLFGALAILALSARLQASLSTYQS